MRIPRGGEAEDSVKSPADAENVFVGINHFEAGRRLADHLRAAGARRVAYLMQANRAPCVQNRWLGLKFGCEGLDLAAEPIFVESDDKPVIRTSCRSPWMYSATAVTLGTLPRSMA